MTEDEMVRWHHRLSGHEFGWTPGVGDGQGGLACCGSWGSFQMSQLFTSGVQSIGVSASASVLPVNIQD